MKSLAIRIPEEAIRDFCRKHPIHRLAFLGSVLWDDFTPESDVDVLIEFEPDHCVGLITFAALEKELSDILARRVELNTPNGLSPYFRDEVLKEPETLYVTP